MIGNEVDLHLRVRSDDGADVASLDHDVASLAELALPLAHDLANVRVLETSRVVRDALLALSAPAVAAYDESVARLI